VRTIEERINGCHECLTDISTPAASNKLLDLIYLHDRGSLRYPSKPMISLISLSVIRHVLLDPVSQSDCFTCEEHRSVLADIVIEKLGKPVLHNISCQISQCSNALKRKLDTKPLSRKVLKL
jgi:hypothetical protein